MESNSDFPQMEQKNMKVESSPKFTNESDKDQGNSLRNIDKKTVRNETIFFTFVLFSVTHFILVRNHVKLRGFSKDTLLFWWILAMGLADLLGIADLHCPKIESTKWLKLKLRATIGGQ